MDWTVCSRETERDYTWDNTHASHLVSKYAQEFFSPAFEGSLTTSRVATLFRCQGVLSGVVLGVSVDTLRKDFRNRPIRTMVFLRAEKPEEANLLARFFAECLRKLDAETIYNAGSGVAKAVESLYQTKKLDDFMQFCRSLPTVNGGGVKLADRWAIPRGEAADRSALVESLPALIGDNAPFLLALTDRLPTDVLASLGSMFDHAVVRIFSKATEKPEKLPEPASQKYRWAAAIGGAAILVILAVAIGTCSRGQKVKEGSGESVLEHQQGNSSSPEKIVEVNTLSEPMRSALHDTYERLTASFPDIGPLESCPLVNKDGVLMCEFGESAAIVGAATMDSPVWFEVHGKIYSAWKTNGGVLGRPVANESDYHGPDARAGDRCSEFEKGVIVLRADTGKTEMRVK